jgi:UDP-N-acetylmuramate--alanine ligase
MKNKKVFLVGVGGIGVSALAKYFYKNSYEISGSNLEINNNITELQKNFSLNFFGTHAQENFTKDFDFLVYSPAVPESNPERIKAKKLGIKQYSYPEFLGEISKEKYTVSIAGTNGKTTTTAMVAELLKKFDVDPTVIVGGLSKKFNSNFILGDSDIFVVESCEYKDSFMHIHPNIIAITNITPDHLDYFGTIENYKKAFLNYLENARGEEKILICNMFDKNLKDVVERALELGFIIVDYKKYQVEKVSIPGEYNRENAQVALAVADIFKIDLEKSQKYLADEFMGSVRRFEYIGKTNLGMEVYDDYAHNPEGLSVLLAGVKEKFFDKKNILIFQPHLFSRTENFFDMFVESISKYDVIYLLPICKARENPEDFSITSKILFDKIKEKNNNIFLFEDIKDCVKKIQKENYDSNYVLLTVGAGNVNEIGKNLILS